jgi:O-methyltransferase domain/Dimerisation domain
MTDLDPSGIMAIATGYWRSKVLLSTVGLGLFSELAGGSLTRREIQGELGLQPRPAADFLDGLVSMGLLVRDGEGEGARYGNTPETAHFLDRRSPAYIGGILELWEARNFRFWADLTEALETGRAQNETKHSKRPFFETLYEDPARLEAFMNAMTGSSIANFEMLAEKFPFERYRTLTDVGGANGLLCRLVAKAHPHLSCTTFDLPAVTEVACKAIAADGLDARIATVAGDFFADPLPRADVITMGMILHDWNLERKKVLVRKAYDALPENGAFVVIEALIDDARRKNTFGLMLSLNMLIEFGDAFDYTGAEFRSWCEEAGFRRFEVIPLAGPSSAAVAYK